MVCLFFVLKQYFGERNELAGHTYMGVSQTGSTDVYGGVNYGGNNTSGNTDGSGQNDTYNGPWQPYQ